MLPPSRFALRLPGCARHVRAAARAAAFGSFDKSASASLRLLAVGVGVLVMFIGVALRRAEVRAAARERRSAGRRGASAAPPATLARDNARRNPRRTASTAAALMIGLALVTFVAVLAAGIEVDLRDVGRQAVQRAICADVAERVHAEPIASGDALARCPASQVVSGVRGRRRRASRARPGITGVEPTSAAWSTSLEGRLATRCSPSSAPTARSSTRTTRRITICPSGRRCRCSAPTGKQAEAADQGDLQAAEGRLAVRHRDDLLVAFDRSTRTRRTSSRSCRSAAA